MAMVIAGKVVKIPVMTERQHAIFDGCISLDDEMTDSIDRQNAEFDALVKLSEQWTVLSCVAVVDDDYPYYRRRYENAMREFIAAIRNNGRLK